MFAAGPRTSPMRTAPIVATAFLACAWTVALSSALAQTQTFPAARGTPAQSRPKPTTTAKPAAQRAAKPAQKKPNAQSVAKPKEAPPKITPAPSAKPALPSSPPARLEPLPPVDTTTPPPQLPRASRERMRACAEEWDAMKRHKTADLPAWREFATECLTRQSRREDERAPSKTAP